MSTRFADALAVFPEQEWPAGRSSSGRTEIEGKDELMTHAGHPIPIANAASIVSPFPRPRALYMLGAKSGNPKPATHRKKETAANAIRRVRLKLEPSHADKKDAPDAACKVNASMT